MLNKSVIPPTDQEIEEICRIINQTLGFNYTAQKKYLIESRLNKRLLQLGIDNYQTYLARLRQDAQERDILCELLTTNVTSFFREPVQFKYLAGTLLPRFSAEKKDPKRSGAGPQGVRPEKKLTVSPSPAVKLWVKTGI